MGGRAVAKQQATRGWERVGEMAGGELGRLITPATEETEKAEQEKQRRLRKKGMN
jgi:hypothetical protein